jgi:hypothetical protein
MTAQSKTVIKSYFETGDRPTQAQFVDLIDSYQNVNSNLTTLASANVGTVGLQILGAVTSASALNHLGPSAIGASLFVTPTTAAAQQTLGGGTVGRQVFQAVTTADVTNIIGTATSATTAVAGIIKIATTAEATAGTNAEHALTPSNAGSNKLLANNGYYVHIGGLIDQWGFDLGATDDGVVTFPLSFVTSCYSVTIGQTSPNNDVEIAVVSVSAGAFNYSHVGANTGSFYWQAKGK